MEDIIKSENSIRNKSIYVMISRTSSGFGRLVRKCGRLRYNHAAISLDDSFEHLYAYARPKHQGLLLAGLVRESLDRYVMKENFDVPIVVFKFDVSEEEYASIDEYIKKSLGNSDYLYNGYSVMTSPIFKGFSVNKSFSCIEFVSFVLIKLGYLDGKACKYRPDDFLELFSNKIVFKGDIREKVRYIPEHSTYYERLTFREFLLSIKTFFKLTARTFMQIFRRKAVY